MFRSTEPIVWEETRYLIWLFSVEPQVFSSKNNSSKGIEYAAASSDDIDLAVGRLRALDANDTGENTATLKRELQSCMQNYFGVFRDGEYMKKGREELNVEGTYRGYSDWR